MSLNRFAVVGGLIASLLASSLVRGQAESVAKRPPNIVLIMADDAGVDAFSSYGSTSCKTPAIDRLARDGIRFLQCHSQPLCTPTRVKLLTGKSNARNYEAFSVLRKGERTFAHVLKDAGYKTCVVGKWQLLGAEHYPPQVRASGTTPKDAGFDEWRLWQVEKLGKRYWSPSYDTNGSLETAGTQSYGPDLYTDYLLDFIDRNKDGPFLAYYPMALVHDPFLPTPDSTDTKRRADPKHFVAMVSYMDRLVARIRKKVDDLGIADNTVFLFTSDNGTHRKIRSKVRGESGAELTVRGGKGRTLATGTHVPLIAYWPGTIRPGSVCADLIDFSDFFASFADLAGVDGIKGIDGRSFVPQLRGQPGRTRDALYCYYHPRPMTRKKSKAVRYAFDARYKLYADGRFFDVAADAREATVLTDLDEATRAARARLQRVLDSMPIRDNR